MPKSMEDKYQDILPLLISRFDRENLNVDEELDSFDYDSFAGLLENIDTLLLEDKIPPQLLKAYRKLDTSSDRHSDMIPDRDAHQSGPISGYDYPLLQNLINKLLAPDTDRDSRRRNFADLGKAHYDKLSKQEVVDFLGLNITVDNHELNINDPFPYTTNPRGSIVWPNLQVTSNDPQLGEKILELRFLVSGNLYIIQRTDDGYFNPIIRTQIPEEAFEKAGLPVKIAGNSGERTPKYLQWHDIGNHANDRFRGKSLNNVYIWIKLADEIFKTDDFSSEIISAENNSIAFNLSDGYRTRTDMETAIKSYILIRDVCKKGIASEFLNSAMPLPTNTKAAIENLSKQAMQEFNIDISNWHNLENILTLTPQGKVKLKPSLDAVQNYVAGIRLWSYVDMVKLDSSVDTLISKYKADNPAYATELINKFIDSWDKPTRVKQLLKRKVTHGQNRGTQLFKIKLAGDKISKLPGEYKYSPWNYWRSQLTSVNNIGILDNGAHQGGSALRNNPSLSRLFNQKRADLISAQKKYNRIKKHSDVYDDELEYQTELDHCKETLDNATAEYKQFLKLVDEYKRQGLDFYDNMTRKCYARFINYYKTLQSMYTEMRKVADDINVIKNYTKQELIDHFGVKTIEEIKALEKALSDCIAAKNALEQAKQEHQRQLEELMRQVEAMKKQIDQDDQDIEHQLNLFNEYNSELEKASTTVEQALVNSYKARAELANKGDALLAQTNRFKQLHGVDSKTPEAKPLKDDVMNLLGDLNDLVDDCKLSSVEQEVLDDALDPDDILDDSEEE